MILEFGKGIPIFDQGNRGDCLFILISGSVVVESAKPTGRAT
jgi:CRP-like cAMP-binding protein